MISKFITIAILLVVTLPSCFEPTLESEIDNILSMKYTSKEPGAVFLVAKAGKPVYRKAFGKANIELDVDMNTENVFQIGSMTKQFTAVAIMMLVEEGKLSVVDEITKFIPEFPTHDKTITIHHLLTHTSGIKDYTSMKSIGSIAEKDLSPSELIDFFKNEPMDFAPGEEFQYNNSGYIILGYIIELISGMRYEDFVEENIFQKVGMKNSRYANAREVIENRAYGYQQNKNELMNKMHISFNVVYSAGALMSTVDDLLKWQNAINNNLLVNEDTKNQLFTNWTLNNGKEIDYGYGWHLKEIRNTLSREHGGNIFGFKSMAVYVLESDIYVVGLTNCDFNSPTQLTRDIVSLTMQFFNKN
ncbi:serine hydrolase domain-containing protein [uncultured Draconibacterium sp.]|uniref:serine hydrolase domain-containing protein n=1 Tax=uncultured Draconibacterium sp. TaxID=1573823 RepID=UPI0029C794DB|nr:serine hydrolase domain-containing protein [uncultured Draconibacterium sp.]